MLKVSNLYANEKLVETHYTIDDWPRIQVFRNFVIDLSHLSKCEERKVAAVITDQELTQIHSIGINGGPKGLAQCLCKTDGKYGCIHAEINALVKCTNMSKDKVMFVSLTPCKQCAAAIINSGFSVVFYVDDWKEDSGILLLKEAGILVVQV
jgi:dCMP deaminase